MKRLIRFVWLVWFVSTSASATKLACRLAMDVMGETNPAVRGEKIVRAYRTLLSDALDRPLSTSELAALARDPFDLGADSEAGRAELRQALALMKAAAQGGGASLSDRFREIARAIGHDVEVRDEGRERTAKTVRSGLSPEVALVVSSGLDPIVGGRLPVGADAKHWVWNGDRIGSASVPEKRWPQLSGRAVTIAPKGTRALVLPTAPGHDLPHWHDLATGNESPAPLGLKESTLFSSLDSTRFSPDEKWLLVRTQNFWHVVGLEGQSARSEKVAYGGGSVAFGKTSFWVGDGSEVRRFSLFAPDDFGTRISPEISRLGDVSLSPDGALVFAMGSEPGHKRSRRLHVLNPEMNRPISVEVVPEAADFAALSADGKILVAARSAPDEPESLFWLYSVPAMTVLGSGQTKRPVSGISISPDGTKVVFFGSLAREAGHPGWMEIYDIAGWQSHGTLRPKTLGP